MRLKRQQSYLRSVTKLRVALNFVSSTLRGAALAAQQLVRSILSKHAINSLMAGVLTLTIVGSALPYLIDAYNQQQARIPKPLASEAEPSSAPAADAVIPAGKAAAVTDALASQLS